MDRPSVTVMVVCDRGRVGCCRGEREGCVVTAVSGEGGRVDPSVMFVLSPNVS